MTEDIRWMQRFDNFKKSLKQLDNAIALMAERDLNDLEQQGVIQAFEYNYELAWNTLKDFYEYQGEQNIQGSRDAIRVAFKRGMIANGDVWMKMIKSRGLTVHTYNEEVTLQILEDIIYRYYPEFVALREKLTQLMAHHD
ncbi:nucleotidyltransferase substrate binding protein [Pelotalea chapellei]|uniref:HI0074 family nucleotidyltransferase substrate-binding subunit n=1 Tax=Pelotalea chapellei TaxID=44671 RepID=A0ABS5U5H9_9BACT|nr:nucleotidyltransferase substrate binding protein [Pelotalea chapellei]MBT1070927.1 HI0074 family nucleotidyltransferase substrate-binding subunit [Pelotalea chapellei]